jgi:SAM-dependent methyltransferase
MGVASHLGIRIEDYDRTIATFIPDYAEMLDVAARVAALSLSRRRPTRLLDLGVGSGALAGRCLTRATRARAVGVDLDERILALATRRLGTRLVALVGNLAHVPLPPADAITASFSLHHLRTRRAKQQVYARCRDALRPGARLVVVDRYLSGDATLDAADRTAWRDHLARAYSRPRAEAVLRAWAQEDVYLTLDVEVALMRMAGLTPAVVWRRNGFAVLAARRSPR